LNKPSGRRTSSFQLQSAQPQPARPTLQKNFVAGLKTEFTGMNFPENACTATSNCVFNRIGNVTRRKGIDYEAGFTTKLIGLSSNAINSFVWTNAGGDGNTQVYVVQSGGNLIFYLLTNASVASPISTTILGTSVNIIAFASTGGFFDNTKECQFAAGNGYLFVFHPSCDPFYCTYSGGAVTANIININIRDFIGIPETIADNYRPLSLTAEHNYNLFNQGWSNVAAWSTSSPTPFTVPLNAGGYTFTVGASVGAVGGDPVTAVGTVGFTTYTLTGTVISYGGTTMVCNITNVTQNGPPVPIGTVVSNWGIYKNSAAQISAFLSAANAYPSNSDVWWTFKNSSGIYSPSTTLASVSLGGAAPKGSIIFNAFKQQRTNASGISGLTEIITAVRPKTGAWFAGRVFYAGVDVSFSPTGDAPFTTWTENIYFSQIVEAPNQFGKCYQVNDPTSENFNALLPSDGGVIVIQGSGSVYKLFALQNGLLVFAANGIWFITGGQGIGFTANDYTVTKISGIKTISGNSVIDVLGLPVFWNADGIYMVTTDLQQASAAMGAAHAGLTVNNITLPSIQSFYQSIPTDSKKYARGDYNPITGIIQWCYRSTQESGIANRYAFDSVLNFNVFTQGFYPWTVSAAGPSILDIKYIAYTQANSPPMIFKYLTSNPAQTGVTFSEEKDSTLWVDWNSSGSPVNYISTFTTAYTLSADGMRRFQPEYLYMYLNNNAVNSYQFRGIRDFGLINSGRWSATQVVKNSSSQFSGLIKKHRVRGHGIVLQFQVNSTNGLPFDIMGWAVMETQNAGI
jgi:hypothetical protein